MLTRGRKPDCKKYFLHKYCVYYGLDKVINLWEAWCFCKTCTAPVGLYIYSRTQGGAVSPGVTSLYWAVVLSSLRSLPPPGRHVCPLENFCFAPQVFQSSTGSPVRCSPLQLRCAFKKKKKKIKVWQMSQCQGAGGSPHVRPRLIHLQSLTWILNFNLIVEKKK